MAVLLFVDFGCGRQKNFGGLGVDRVPDATPGNALWRGKGTLMSESIVFASGCMESVKK